MTRHTRATFSTRLVSQSIRVSTTILIATAIVWAYSFRIDPYRSRLSIGPDFHVTAHAGRLSIFNRADYGPYAGSIVSVRYRGARNTMVLYERGLDLPGIYFRYFRFVDHALWTITCSLVLPACVFSVLPAFSLIRRSGQ